MAGKQEKPNAKQYPRDNFRKMAKIVGERMERRTVGEFTGGMISGVIGAFAAKMRGHGAPDDKAHAVF
jgi:hypothetical protein